MFVFKYYRAKVKVTVAVIRNILSCSSPFIFRLILRKCPVINVKVTVVFKC